VIAGLYAAKAAQQELGDAHVKGALAGTKPLSVVMAEKMLALRLWAAERTVPAD
jgi:hypothetical protein